MGAPNTGQTKRRPGTFATVESNEPHELMPGAVWLAQAAKRSHRVLTLTGVYATRCKSCLGGLRCDLEPLDPGDLELACRTATIANNLVMQVRHDAGHISEVDILEVVVLVVRCAVQVVGDSQRARRIDDSRDDGRRILPGQLRAVGRRRHRWRR